MKIKLTYKPHEEQEAAADLAALLQLHPDARVHKSDKNPPLKSIYVSTKSPEILRRQGICLDGHPPMWYNYYKKIGHGSTVRKD